MKNEPYKMKNTTKIYLLLLVVLGILFSLPSCKKEEQKPAEQKRCFECETIKSIQRNNGMATTSTTAVKNYCNQTTADAKIIEQSGTYSRNEIEYTQTIFVISKTTCK